MKLTIKTLQQKMFQVRNVTYCLQQSLMRIKLEAEGSETIADLKQKISNTQGHSVESQKLIFSGTALQSFHSITVFIRHRRQDSYR